MPKEALKGAAMAVKILSLENSEMTMATMKVVCSFVIMIMIIIIRERELQEDRIMKAAAVVTGS